VVLFGTYCGTDISGSSLRVLTVAGQQDGLFSPAKISAARSELPAGARLEHVSGMNHAQFGNYGEQAGDNAPTIDDTVARQALVRAVSAFFSERQATR
jgi:hypothetical protein